jgi:hypothetical protein
MRSVVAVAFALLVVLPLQAHVTVPTEFREVVADASLIVRGRVTDVRSVALPGGGVDSVATVAVENTLKGLALDGFVYVRVPGGDLGRYKFVMVGAPTFKAGQRAVFFLKPGTTDSAYRPIGLTLGVFRVQAEPGTGRPVVEPPVVPGRTTGLLTSTVRGDVRRRWMPVQEFESLVRLIAGPQATSAPTAGAAVPGTPAAPTPWWRRR